MNARPPPGPPEPSALLPLNRAACGQRVRIAQIHAGHAARLRLAAMGLLPGTTMAVTRAGGRGPMVVAVRGGRLALGRGLAGAVMVVPEAT